MSEPSPEVAHLKPGLAIPNIALPATNAEPVRLAELTGRSLVYCYTWTGRRGTPNPPDWDVIPGAHGSTPETEGFRDLHQAFLACGVNVFGMSTQASDYQQEMVARLQVPFPVLSDAAMRFSRALRLPTFETGGQAYLKRLSLLLNDGAIERLFYPVPDPDTHARAVLDAL